ncbi:hypothetical protein Pelo_2028 [Pelomyxa schiedti]|nr:hypothetical protein Pelo_2028 [Pelomyxa schiedti]
MRNNTPVKRASTVSGEVMRLQGSKTPTATTPARAQQGQGTLPQKQEQKQEQPQQQQQQQQQQPPGGGGGGGGAKTPAVGGVHQPPIRTPPSSPTVSPKARPASAPPGTISSMPSFALVAKEVMEKGNASSTEWMKSQEKTFTKWVNSHLVKDKGPLVVSVNEAFTSGINLIRLIHILFGCPLPKYNPSPKFTAQSLDNISKALVLVENLGIKSTLKPIHLVEQNAVFILGLMWQVVQAYNMKRMKEGRTLNHKIIPYSDHCNYALKGPGAWNPVPKSPQQQWTSLKSIISSEKFTPSVSSTTHTPPGSPAQSPTSEKMHTPLTQDPPKPVQDPVKITQDSVKATQEPTKAPPKVILPESNTPSTADSKTSSKNPVHTQETTAKLPTAPTTPTPKVRPMQMQIASIVSTLKLSPSAVPYKALNNKETTKTTPQHTPPLPGTSNPLPSEKLAPFTIPKPTKAPPVPTPATSISPVKSSTPNIAPPSSASTTTPLETPPLQESMPPIASPPLTSPSPPSLLTDVAPNPSKIENSTTPSLPVNIASPPLCSPTTYSSSSQVEVISPIKEEVIPQSSSTSSIPNAQPTSQANVQPQTPVLPEPIATPTPEPIVTSAPEPIATPTPKPIATPAPEPLIPIPQPIQLQVSPPVPEAQTPSPPLTTPPQPPTQTKLTPPIETIPQPDSQSLFPQQTSQPAEASVPQCIQASSPPILTTSPTNSTSTAPLKSHASHVTTPPDAKANNSACPLCPPSNIVAPEKRELSTKELLMDFCQKCTKPYSVFIKDFTSSFADGVAFLCLVGKYIPDKVNIEASKKSLSKDNLEVAFSLAETELGIPRLLDVEDFIGQLPHELSVMTYISEFLHCVPLNSEPESISTEVGTTITPEETSMNSPMPKLLHGSQLPAVRPKSPPPTTSPYRGRPLSPPASQAQTALTPLSHSHSHCRPHSVHLETGTTPKHARSTSLSDAIGKPDSSVTEVEKPVATTPPVPAISPVSPEPSECKPVTPIQNQPEVIPPNISAAPVSASVTTPTPTTSGTPQIPPEVQRELESLRRKALRLETRNTKLEDLLVQCELAHRYTVSVLTTKLTDAQKTITDNKREHMNTVCQLHDKISNLVSDQSKEVRHLTEQITAHGRSLQKLRAESEQKKQKYKKKIKALKNNSRH